MTLLFRTLTLAIAAAVAPLGHAAVVTFDSSGDLNLFNVDIFPGDNFTEWRPGYSASGGYAGSDGGFVHFNLYSGSNTLQFKAGPVFLNGFDISSQYGGAGGGVSNADNNGRDYVLELYGPTNALISSQALLVGADGTWDYVSTETANVSSLRILATWSAPGVYDGWWPNLDNIRYNENEIPEPGTLGLLGLSLAGFAASRKRLR
jgi:hypothetical protein